MAEEKKTAPVPTPKVAVKRTGDKVKFSARISRWFREMKSELKKVVWPTPKQTTNSSIVAVVMMVVSAVLLWGFDSGAQAVVKALINIFS
jgi:preprotein translocase, SecE subunit, bacterial